MNPKKSRAIPVKIITALAIIAAILLTIFLIGRYGWKLGGFRACQSAAIENVEVTDRQVTITGYYPGFFRKVFLAITRRKPMESSMLDSSSARYSASLRQEISTSRSL